MRLFSLKREGEALTPCGCALVEAPGVARPSQRFRRTRGARRKPRSRRQRRYEPRASCGRIGKAVVGAARLRARLAMARVAQRQSVVSDRPLVPPAGARRLVRPRSTKSRRRSASASSGAESSNTRPCAARMRVESDCARRAIAGNRRDDADVVVDIARDQFVDAHERQHAHALPAAHEASGQRHDGQPARQRVEAGVAARPMQRIEHRVAQRVEAQVVLMGDTAAACAKPAVGHRRRAPSLALKRAVSSRIASFETDDHARPVSLQHPREQRIVVGMDLEQRLRA